MLRTGDPVDQVPLSMPVGAKRARCGLNLSAAMAGNKAFSKSRYLTRELLGLTRPDLPRDHQALSDRKALRKQRSRNR
jgi:hypothetical protein